MLFIFKRKFKKVKGPLVVAISLLIIIILRAYYIYSINRQFVQNMEYDRNLGQAKYYLEDEGYVFKYAKATFFHSEYFASVCKEEDLKCYLDNNGNLCTKGLQIVLFIWPGKEYGLDFYQMDEEKEINEQIRVDKELKNLSVFDNAEYSAFIDSLIQENRDDILKLFEEAEDKWKISGKK